LSGGILPDRREARITEMYVPGLTERVEVLEKRLAELLPRKEKEKTSVSVDDTKKAIG
jgi:hypothetical protein